MSQNQERSQGFWAGLARQVRLAWRLLWDPRVPLLYKLVPLMGFIYILSPVDFIPDPILGLGQLDDLGILLLGLRVFVELIPEDIVLQHLNDMGSRINEWRGVDEEPTPIDAEYKVKDN